MQGRVIYRASDLSPEERRSEDGFGGERAGSAAGRITSARARSAITAEESCVTDAEFLWYKVLLLRPPQMPV
jgi:hypothetical protein